MARAAKLKVFRTAIGFHDAYVAASSRKAALAAWGSTADLFARGMAEQVDDPALTREALVQPGTVVRRRRGTAEQNIAALPKDYPAASAKRRGAPAPSGPAPAAGGRKVKKPDRAPLDRAQAALDEAAAQARETDAGLRARIDALEQERRSAAKAHAARMTKLERAVATAKQRYDERMERWRSAQ